MAKIDGKTNLLTKTKKSSLLGPFLTFLVITFVVFLLTDILKINNIRGDWRFLTGGNALNVLSQVSINAIISYGMTLIIIILGIDLSVGSIIALSGVSFIGFYEMAGIPFILSILLTLVLGLVLGAFNGVIIAKAKIPPFVVTLGSNMLFRGIALVLCDGIPWASSKQPFLDIAGKNVFGVIPMPIIILIVVTVIFYYLLHKTRFGRYVYAIGGNEETARLAGINVDWTKIKIFTLSGIAASISGLILASKIGSGAPLSGDGYELDAVAATVIGGTSISGGVGRIVGTLIGAMIIGVISNGMNLLNIEAYWQYVIRGGIILIAMILDYRSHS